MSETSTISAFHTVTQLAGQTAVHRAFQWFHLQEPKLRDWHRRIASIPAPPFGEAARAHWLAEQFTAVGLTEVHIDPCGNTLGWMRGATATGLCTLISAHLDTVFPAESINNPIQDDTLLTGPSASDNCAGITALLAIAAAMQSAHLQAAGDILFAGNVGEEGEGNLRGMRYIFTESPIAARIRSAVILDGAGTESIVTQALGSKRFRIAITGPGGHSWTDNGTPNAILVLANALAAIGQIELPSSPRTTWSIGHISGGTSINAIPQDAEARIDTRSTGPAALIELEQKIRQSVEEAVAKANLNTAQQLVRSQIEGIGERPAATLPDNAAILATLRAVDRHLGIRSQPRIASTDANIPLSLGIEALSIGSGGSGGGVHTPQEWFDAAGRDLALRRILLLLLALAQAEL
jgi:tripeptide aminopeptidase